MTQPPRPQPVRPEGGSRCHQRGSRHLADFIQLPVPAAPRHQVRARPPRLAAIARFLGVLISYLSDHQAAARVDEHLALLAAPVTTWASSTSPFAPRRAAARTPAGFLQSERLAVTPGGVRHGPASRRRFATLSPADAPFKRYVRLRSTRLIPYMGAKAGPCP